MRCGAEVEPDASSRNCLSCGGAIFCLVYRTDLTVNQAGAIIPIDHKTTSSLSDTYLESWQYSPQLYLYLRGTQANFPQADRFQMNFLRKAKTVGKMKERACPACRNGAKKRLSCDACRTQGKIEVPACDPPPFHRDPPIRHRPEVMDRVCASRLATCVRIDAEPTDISADPYQTWRMAPDKCFEMGRCPFIDLCWSKGTQERWFEPAEDLLDGYHPRPADYVTLAQEDQV